MSSRGRFAKELMDPQVTLSGERLLVVRPLAEDTKPLVCSVDFADSTDDLDRCQPTQRSKRIRRPFALLVACRAQTRGLHNKLVVSRVVRSDHEGLERRSANKNFFDGDSVRSDHEPQLLRCSHRRSMIRVEALRKKDLISIRIVDDADLNFVTLEDGEGFDLEPVQFL